MHNELIQSGFFSYVSSCNERILEEITNPETTTRWFAKVVE